MAQLVEYLSNQMKFWVTSPEPHKLGMTCNPSISKVDTGESDNNFKVSLWDETLSQKKKIYHIIKIRTVKFIRMINSRSFYQEDMRSDIEIDSQ